MKKYKFTFSLWVLLLIYSGFACALGGIVLNIYNFINNPQPVTYNYITLISVSAVSVAYFIFAIAMLVNSYYCVDDKYFSICWGFLKNKLEIKSITKASLNSAKHELAIFFNEEDFFVIKSRTIDFTDLVSLLRQKNGKICVDFVSSDDEKN